MQEIILISFGLSVLAPWMCRFWRRGTGWLLGLAVAGMAVYLAGYLEPVASGEAIRTSLPWFAGLNVHLSFHLDGLSLVFGLLITSIGALILIYAGGYLPDYGHLGRLYAFLTAFLGSMLGLVFADNVLTLFVFWELTSLTSYFLIGINHDRSAARSAALQALLVTGGGGLALLAGLILLGQIGGSYELSVLALRRSAIIEHGLYGPMLVLILIGTFTKSAQVPFHFWLPNAMEAPTPVSAYLHSATMVKAGVYLLARLHPTIGETQAWTVLVAGVGGATFLVGAAMAVAQADLKRILAYSTVSILGALTLLIGLGSSRAVTTAMVLLIAHALYKAALFLVAGGVDHSAGTRDLRRLGGLGRAMPITAAAALIAAASNAGLPATFGFLAKEAMYESIGGSSAGAIGLLIVAIAANALLVVAAAMVGWGPFFGRIVRPSSGGAKNDEDQPPAVDGTSLTAPHESPPSMWLGPALLSLGSVVLAVWPAWIEPLVGRGASAIRGAAVDARLTLWHGFNLVLVLSAITIVAGVVLYVWRTRLLDRLHRLRAWGRWGPDRGYAFGLQTLNLFARAQTRFLQSGYLRFYLMTILVTMIGLTTLALARGADTLSTIELKRVVPYEWVPMVLILCAALMAVTVGSRLTAVAALGTLGYNVAVIFVLFGAPDLAMTQFAVETLTVILFVLVLYRLPRFTQFSGNAVRLRDALIAGAVGALMTFILLAVTAEPLESRLSGYFAEHSLPLAKGRNIVNVILVDFRALDTLGEISVLAIAAIGIRALVRLIPPEDRSP